MKVDRCHHLLLIIFAINCVALMFMLPSTSSFVRADSVNPGVYSIDSKPYGLTYADWTVKWWQWFNEIPQATNPAADKTGSNCGLQQSGPIWFLAGTTGGSAERSCTVPAGKAILFPIITSECSYAEFPNLKSESDLRSCATHLQNGVTSLVATLDGMNLQNLAKYRVVTPLFNQTLPPGNVAGAPAGPTQGLADGNWVFLSPLSAGKHEIHFSGASVDITNTAVNNFAIDTTYHLTVK